MRAESAEVFPVRRRSRSLRSVVVELALIAAAVAGGLALLKSDLPLAIGQEIGRSLFAR
jgi:hypothetical protein